jgi:general L-amino acid transport system permease protein
MTTSVHHERPPFWRNTNVLKWGVQLAVLVAVIAVFWFLVDQAANNLTAKGFDVNYDWLNNPANIQVSEGIQTANEPDHPFNFGRALWVGMVNTLRVAGVGIVASTILGVVIGVARLSSNWLAQKMASIYVETLRNIPVLVQILLWFAIIGAIGNLTEDTGPIKGWVYISQKGISIPRVFYADGFYQFISLMIVLMIGVWLVRRYLHKKQETEGGDQHVGLITLAFVAIAIAIAWFANGIMAWPRGIFNTIGDWWGDIPVAAMQIILSAMCVLAAAWWIKRFLDSRRTPAGLAKLTDDDYFRMIFAVLGALVMVAVIFVAWPGLSSWVVNSGADFWHWLGAKFGGGRGTRPIDAMKPALTEGRFVNYAPSGLTMTAFFASLFFGLVFYTSAFIAEIVRGGILAVPKGQAEAAAALGLSRMQALRKVVLPQAFRVIMPPLGNQYLNITKNTSLGIAVGFSEIVQVGQTVYNKNNQTLAVFSIYMVFFLACSLTISVIVNYINNKLAIVER